jgi:hypothetical protein
LNAISPLATPILDLLAMRRYVAAILSWDSDAIMNPPTRCRAADLPMEASTTSRELWMFDNGQVEAAKSDQSLQESCSQQVRKVPLNMELS